MCLIKTESLELSERDTNSETDEMRIAQLQHVVAHFESQSGSVGHPVIGAGTEIETAHGAASKKQRVAAGCEWRDLAISEVVRAVEGQDANAVGEVSPWGGVSNLATQSDALHQRLATAAEVKKTTSASACDSGSEEHIALTRMVFTLSKHCY